jgi:hypothetical protein
MFALESLRRSTEVERQTIVLDDVFRSRAELRATLAARLGGEILGVRVVEVDYVRDVTRVEAEFRVPGEERARERAAPHADVPAPARTVAPAYATLLEHRPERLRPRP